MSQQTNQVVIEQLTEFSDDDYLAISALLPQLSSSTKSLNYEDFVAVVTAEANRVYVARSNDAERKIVGCMIFVIVRQFVGIKCWIEDVVVDDGYRGQGIARAMMQQAMDDAPPDAKHINLTSAPGRAAAQGLYPSLGFQVRDTVVFRYTPAR
jgi:ribosomal protein S18 acetylase RimI-like enzyme